LLETGEKVAKSFEVTSVDHDCPYCQGRMRHPKSGRKRCKAGMISGTKGKKKKK